MSLTTTEINKFMFSNSAVNRYFLGTFPACQMPLISQKWYCFITNTDEHDKPGQHWNAWFVKNGQLSFLDTFGRSIDDVQLPSYYRDYVKNFHEYEYCKIPIQSISSKNCGLFCIHFTYLMSFGFDFEYFLNQFYFNVNLNDNVVEQFYNSVL